MDPEENTVTTHLNTLAVTLRWLAGVQNSVTAISVVTVNILSHWQTLQRTRGLMWTVSRFKDYRLHCTRFIAGQPLKVSKTFASLSKDGLPNILKGVGKDAFRRGDPKMIRMILTILSIGKLIPGSGEIDITPIITPWNGQIPHYLVDWIYKIPLKKVECDFRWPHWSTKAGPKGQAMASSLADLMSLPSALKDNIIKLGGPTVECYINNIYDQGMVIGAPNDIAWQKPSIRRIHAILDKEGKTRPIAILDYWSQTVLKPYHN